MAKGFQKPPPDDESLPSSIHIASSSFCMISDFFWLPSRNPPFRELQARHVPFFTTKPWLPRIMDERANIDSFMESSMLLRRVHSECQNKLQNERRVSRVHVHVLLESRSSMSSRVQRANHQHKPISSMMLSILAHRGPKKAGVISHTTGSTTLVLASSY